MTPTAALFAFAAAPHTLPPQVRADAVRLLGDTLAVGAAGASAPGARAVLDVMRSHTEGPTGDARVLTSGYWYPPSAAAFVNGYQIHALEWDAVHEPAVVHAMSVVTAALGAAIDRRAGGGGGGCDPDEALVALAVGVDIACGLGIAADTPLSFFRPATAGLIGAALAVARFDNAPLADTLGLAYSSCAGTMQAHVEGSVALPFQIGNAARAAIVAADLARAGLTGPHDALEGPFGYFRLFDRGDLSRYTTDLGRVWRIAEISTKPYPCGRAAHGVLAALQGRSGIVAVEAFVPPLVARLVARPFDPVMAPAYARLCLPLLAALILTDGTIDPRRFTLATFADPAIAALAARVTVTVDDNGDPNALAPQRVRLTFTDGRIEYVAIPVTLGSPDAPMTPSQAAAKRTLARTIAGDVGDQRVFDDPLSYFCNPGAYFCDPGAYR